eukprot:RCo009355
MDEGGSGSCGVPLQHTMLQKRLQEHAQAKLLLCGAKHYRLEKIVGKGSYGIVYEAYDNFHERKVAIKHLCPDVFREPLLALRVLREISILAHFRQHPNIMGLVDVLRTPSPPPGRGPCD